jgi:hypothetical protein
MTAWDMGAISPAEQRMLDILSRPEIGPQATLAALREAALVPPADGYEVRTLHPADLVVDPRVIELAPAPLVHLDPRRPFKADGTNRAGVHATDTEIVTWGNPSHFKLPSSPQYFPYLNIFFWRPAQAGQQFTATLDMQVYRGTVQIKAAYNPLDIRLSRGARVPVPITLTLGPTGSLGEGFGSVSIQRMGESGFYWYGVDLRPA